MRLAALAIVLTAVPALADPKPAPKPAIYTGTLVDVDQPIVQLCGTEIAYTIVFFDLSKSAHPPVSPDFKAHRVPVAVPCIEMTRPMFSKTAGNAGVLAKGKRYTVHLDSYGRSQPAFEAVKIDNAL